MNYAKGKKREGDCMIEQVCKYQRDGMCHQSVSDRNTSALDFIEG